MPLTDVIAELISEFFHCLIIHIPSSVETASLL